VAERVTAIPDAWYTSYVVRGDTASLMLDAGVNHLGPCYLAALGEILGDADELDHLFLSHSHYDHLGGASYLKRRLPHLKIAAHHTVAGLLQKPSVLETMNRLSAHHPELLRYNPGGEDVTVWPFAIDLPLREGDELDLGGLTCRVYETPGHTRDAISLFFPEIGTLLPGESCGALEGDRGDGIMVGFLSGYEDYLDSIRRMASLAPRTVCLAHGFVLTGEDAARYFDEALAAAVRHRELIEHRLEAEDGDIERTVHALLRSEYDEKTDIHQGRQSYLVNLTAQVKHIAGLRSAGG
jgi:glyoxylase-like metal-dependent hydrolase (beta-lactamase superfamily II)